MFNLNERDDLESYNADDLFSAWRRRRDHPGGAVEEKINRCTWPLCLECSDVVLILDGAWSRGQKPVSSSTDRIRGSTD